ncbi:MAG TPA: hypothetical protein VN958_02100, partial [Chitinophagaceae bacterium]|nr:hypothetical protein [Chitinophagaceae bacterium]
MSWKIIFSKFHADGMQNLIYTHNEMKICAAQTRPVKGDIQSNIDNHKKLIGLAVSKGAETIIFP